MRFKQEYAGKDGWSRWITPVMRGYLMACCDCGLVHEVQYNALITKNHTTRGRFRAKKLPSKEFRVEFRVKRRDGLTAKKRAAKKG